MNNLSCLPLLEQYILANGATARFTVPFLTRQNKFNVELHQWEKYGDLKKGIITIRQSGIRVKAPNYYPCLTYNPVISIIYDDGYRYLNKQELLSLQSFPIDYQFPPHYSLTKIASLLGNSINLTALKHFLKDKNLTNLIFIDLFAGIGGFHLALKEYGQCALAVDKNKSCQATYQLNFPLTPFCLGDINDKKTQKQIINTDFDLLCAGFPCQPYSRAGKSLGASPELTSLLRIISKKKPKYLLLENVPNLLSSSVISKFIKSLLTNYHLQISLLNPKDLNQKQNRPRLFIYGQKNHHF